MQHEQINKGILERVGMKVRLTHGVVWLLTQLMVLCVASVGQDEEWRKANDRGNRYEGLIDIRTGKPDFEILSLVGLLEDFRIDANVELRIRFFVPSVSESNLYISAQELVKIYHYWMEVKKREWGDVGWHEFFPWPTEEVIKRQRIRSENLGVLIKVRGSNAILVPALVYYSKSVLPTGVSSYRLDLSINRDLASLRWYVYERNGERIKRRGFLKDPGDTTRINLNVDDLQEGWVRVLFEGQVRDSKDKVTKELRFYHKRLMQ